MFDAHLHTQQVSVVVLCCLDSSVQACRSVAGFSVWGRVLGSTVSSTTRLAEERRSHTPQRCHLPLVQTTTALQHWGVRHSFLSLIFYSLFHVENKSRTNTTRWIKFDDSWWLDKALSDKNKTANMTPRGERLQKCTKTSSIDLLCPFSKSWFCFWGLLK